MILRTSQPLWRNSFKPSRFPPKRFPLLHRSARDATAPPAVLVKTITCLLKLQNEEVIASVLSAMAILDRSVKGAIHLNPGRDVFINHKSLDGSLDELVEFAHGDLKQSETQWAIGALLKLAESKGVSVEAQAVAREEIDLAWHDTDRRALLIVWARIIRNHYLDARIAVALTDPSAAVADQAAISVRHLKIPAARRGQNAQNW